MALSKSMVNLVHRVREFIHESLHFIHGYTPIFVSLLYIQYIHVLVCMSENISPSLSTHADSVPSFPARMTIIYYHIHTFSMKLAKTD